MAFKPANPVTRPAHYTFGTIEPLDALEDWDLDWHEGSALLYVVRAKHKGQQLQDLQKAVFVLQRKIDLLSGVAFKKKKTR